MGTQLAERGVDIASCVEAINLSQPELLRDIAEAYLEAGAEIIQTNTFGASPLKMAAYGLDEKTETIVEIAVEKVRQVVDGKAYVSGSCGPSGRILKPYGDCEESDMYDSFLRQMTAFADAGVDIICVETMTDLIEARLAIRAAREVDPKIPIMATMTFDKTDRGFFTVMGVSIENAAQGLKDAGADIIGSNCGNGIDNMIAIARDFKKNTDMPLIIQSNAGLPKIKNDTLTYPESPEFMAARALELKAAGVSVIGGCCGTTPEHIKAIKSKIKSS
jgi:5-methyltetrahydrofolate--homocysteine methyltransferase